ncbi:MAG: metallophosphoesterase family protein [Lachnospiraceae bacterium]|nr:metallophosphoesterase family protein [Lachnospiraceae bacterium]
MNIAVLSDIHGNHVAFESCLEFLEKKEIDAFILLGDYVGEFPHTEITMDLIYELKKRYPCYIIRGNKEEYQLGGLGNDNLNWNEYPSTIGMIRYAARHTREKDLAFFASLPITMRVELPDMPPLRICHGSPRKVKEDIRPGCEINKEMFAEIEEKYILSGHTHRVTNMEEHGKIVWNPGSVGVALDGSSKAQFMILHGVAGKWEPDFFAVAYDTDKVIQEMKDENLYELAPCWTKVSESLLKGGSVSHGHVLFRAMELCYEEIGRCNWPEVPEKYWQQACREMLGE